MLNQWPFRGSGLFHQHLWYTRSVRARLANEVCSIVSMCSIIRPLLSIFWSHPGNTPATSEQHRIIR